MENLEKIRNKFKNVSDLKLYKIIDRRRFYINLLGIVFFFVLLFFLTSLTTLIPEKFIVITNICKGLIVVFLFLVLGMLDCIYKKIKLPCEIEQDYRINHISKDDVVGYKKITLPNGIIEFKVNEKLKKRQKYKNIVSTFGGKLAVILIFILILTTILLPIYMYLNKNYIIEILNLKGTEYIGEVLIPILVFIAFFVFTLVAIICTYKQRVKVEDNMLVDILKTDGKYLIYQYKPGLKKLTIDGYYLDLIDFSEVRAFYDKSNKHIIVQGKVDEIKLTNKKQISKVKDLTSFSEFVVFIKNKKEKTKELKSENISMKISNYFEPDLAKFLGLDK